MKDKCFDLGTIQAFTDGELGTDLSERLLRHVAVCDACAVLLTECEEESSFAYSVLDDELNVLVPTERLRSKVFGSIEEMESGRRSKWLTELAAGLASLISFRSPGFAVAAMAVIAVGAFAIFVNVYRPPVGPEIANNVEVSEPTSDQIAVTVPSAPDNVRDATVIQPEPGSTKAVERQDSSQFRTSKAVVRRPIRNSRPVRAIPASASVRQPDIVSEGSYLQTIATLEKTVDYSKELLRPSERVSFERDLAVVNNAIKKMRDEVERNPGNEGAREVLKSSYQNKVDLLNSVAEKTELMASLQ